MIVVTFKVKCQAGKIEHALGVMQDVVAPSRALPGVVSFHIARDVTEPDTVLATEVFEDRAALDRQEALPEVARVMGVLPQLVAAPPEAVLYHVSSSEVHV